MAASGDLPSVTAPRDTPSGEGLRAATIRGLRWTFAARPVVEIVLLGSIVVLARLVPPAEFGRYAVAVVAMELGTLPAAGVTAALVQRPEIGRKDLQAGAALAWLTGIAVAVITLVAATTIVDSIFGARTAELVRITAPGSLVAALAAVPSAVLQRRLSFGRLSLIDLFTTTSRAAISIVLAVAGLKGEALVLGALIGGLGGALLTFAWAPAAIPRLHRAATRRLVDYGGPTALAAVAWVGFRNCDYAIVAARLGALQTGYYFRAYNLGVEYQKKVSQVTTSVGFPVLSRAETPEEMDRLRTHMVRTLTVVLFPLLAFLALVAPVFIPWLFGPEWAPATVPTQILAVGGASTLVIDAIGATLMADGRARAILGFGWGHFVTYAAAVMVATSFNLAAVATAAAIVHTLYAIVAYRVLLRGRRETSALRALWSDVGPATISCLGLVAAAAPVTMLLSPTRATAVPYMALLFTIATAGYILTLGLLFPDSWRDLRGFAARLIPVGKLAFPFRVRLRSSQARS